MLNLHHETNHHSRKKKLHIIQIKKLHIFNNLEKFRNFLRRLGRRIEKLLSSNHFFVPRIASIFQFIVFFLTCELFFEPRSHMIREGSFTRGKLQCTEENFPMVEIPGQILNLTIKKIVIS